MTKPVMVNGRNKTRDEECKNKREKRNEVSKRKNKSQISEKKNKHDFSNAYFDDGKTMNIEKAI